MEIYTVRPGDCLYCIARAFGVPMEQLLRDNRLPDPSCLCVGQAVVVQFPEETYVVRSGDTVSSVARLHGLSVRQLLRRNFGLSTQKGLIPGQSLVLSYEDTPDDPLSVCGCIHSAIPDDLLNEAMPYLTAMDSASEAVPEKYCVSYDGSDCLLPQQRIVPMTCQWDCPMAAAPIRSVRQTVERALTEVSPEKIWLGLPTCGYDWMLCGEKTRAHAISGWQALQLASRFRAAIRYDETAQAPWFGYTDDRGLRHEVWFEDARSVRSKLALAQEYGLSGVEVWDLAYPFVQGWVTMNALYDIREEIR